MHVDQVLKTQCPNTSHAGVQHQKAFEAMCKILENAIGLYTSAELHETMDNQNDDVYTVKLTKM